MAKKISIVDIARALNVSATTVSFILNGRAEEKRISESVKKNVLDYIEKVGYKPNSLARSLRTGKSHIIGLLVEDIGNPFFAGIARRIEGEAYKHGYKILYSSTENDSERTKELLKVFSDRQVDGYIVSPPEGIENEVLSLIKGGYPVVLFDRRPLSAEIDSVTIDNIESTYTAVNHLLDKGYLNIGFVTTDSNQLQMQERLTGYKKAVNEKSIPSRVKILPFHHSPEYSMADIAGFIKENAKLDALIFATNYLGINGLKAIRQLNLTIPDDLAIITFDDLDLFELHSPSISVIAQPLEEIADRIIEILLQNLKNTSSKKEVITEVLPAKLIVRNSS